MTRAAFAEDLLVVDEGVAVSARADEGPQDAALFSTPGSTSEDVQEIDVYESLDLSSLARCIHGYLRDNQGIPMANSALVGLVDDEQNPNRRRDHIRVALAELTGHTALTGVATAGKKKGTHYWFGELDPEAPIRRAPDAKRSAKADVEVDLPVRKRAKSSRTLEIEHKREVEVRRLEGLLRRYPDQWVLRAELLHTYCDTYGATEPIFTRALGELKKAVEEVTEGPRLFSRKDTKLKGKPTFYAYGVEIPSEQPPEEQLDTSKLELMDGFESVEDLLVIAADGKGALIETREDFALVQATLRHVMALRDEKREAYNFDEAPIEEVEESDASDVALYAQVITCLNASITAFTRRLPTSKPSKRRMSDSLGGGADSEEKPTWQEYANCLAVDPDLFFPERGASTREAKEVCRGCVVREECLEFALSNGEKFGIWGGMSERERRRLRRQRAIARRASTSA